MTTLQIEGDDKESVPEVNMSEINTTKTQISSGIPKPATENNIADLRGKKILLIEDDHFLQTILAKKFASEGATIIQAVSGDEGVGIVKDPNNQEICLIMLDILLPGVNGFDILKQIREDSNHAKTPVIIISNLSDVDGMKKAEAQGAHFLLKALVSPSEIVLKVRQVLGSANA